MTGIKDSEYQDDNATRTIRFNVADIHLKRLKSAGKVLGHTSRSETMRWLALNAVRFANEKMRQVQTQLRQLG